MFDNQKSALGRLMSKLSNMFDITSLKYLGIRYSICITDCVPNAGYTERIHICNDTEVFLYDMSTYLLLQNKKIRKLWFVHNSWNVRLIATDDQ